MPYTGERDTKLRNHSKVVIVDESLCYIGSDNAYPSVLDAEFGAWLEDPAATASLVEGFWTGLWNKTPLRG